MPRPSQRRVFAINWRLTDNEHETVSGALVEKPNAVPHVSEPIVELK